MTKQHTTWTISNEDENISCHLEFNDSHVLAYWQHDTDSPEYVDLSLAFDEPELLASTEHAQLLAFLTSNEHVLTGKLARKINRLAVKFLNRSGLV